MHQQQRNISRLGINVLDPIWIFSISPGSSGYSELLAICSDRCLHKDAKTAKRKGASFA